MGTLVRIIVTTILSALMLSCNIAFGPGVDGDQNVVVKERRISNNFTAIKVSQGLDLHITQSNTVDIMVEADQNLHELIMTEVENGTLRIYTTKNIRRAAARKIRLNLTDISSIRATSGSEVVSTNTINTKDLELKTTSGAYMKLNIKTEKLNCHATSGSNITLNGSTTALIAEATSGSDIKASNLKAETSKVRATSGADISVHTTKTLTAKATSGADIRYSGNPEKVEKSDNSSGSVRAH